MVPQGPSALVGQCLLLLGGREVNCETPSHFWLFPGIALLLALLASVVACQFPWPLGGSRFSGKSGILKLSCVRCSCLEDQLVHGQLSDCPSSSRLSMKCLLIAGPGPLPLLTLSV